MHFVTFCLLILRSIRIVYFFGLLVLAEGWFEDIFPRITIESDLEFMGIFRGNETYVDYFKLLERDGDYLIVGARNVVYNLTIRELHTKHKLEWYSEPSVVKLCSMKGKNEVSSIKIILHKLGILQENCQNYIRILARKNAEEFLICGTNAYKPKCRIYSKQATDYAVTYEFSGQGYCPYDPTHNSTAVFAEATSKIIRREENGSTTDVIYAVFSTPANSIRGSAICSFRMQDILDVFEGQFKEQETVNSNWLPVPENKIPRPHPGKCVANSETLEESTLNFIKSHPMMDEAVSSSTNSPLYVRTSMSVIAVDPQVPTLDGRKFDIIFVGTDSGFVYKIFEASAGNPIVVEELRVFKDVPIRNFLISESSERRGGHLVVLADHEIASLSLQRCRRNANSCSSCVRLQDPYCAWDGKHCAPLKFPLKDKRKFIQNVIEGRSDFCDPDPYMDMPQILSDVVHDDSKSSQGNFRTSGDFMMPLVTRTVVYSSQTNFPAKTFTAAIASSVLLSLLVGFFVGYCLARKKRLTDFEYGDNRYSNYGLPTRKSDCCADILSCKENNITKNCVNNKNDNFKTISNFECPTLIKTKKTYI